MIHLEKLKITPFVKWAGGKKQLLDKLLMRIPESYGRYYEPFIGGGALLLALQPNRGVINDVNEQLINVYCRLRDDAESVISTVQTFDSVTCDTGYYLEMRSRYNRKIVAGELDAECAALMIWINKHCFNGLYRVNSKGLFNVPYNNKATGSSFDETNLRNIGLFLKSNQIEIRRGDFESACFDVQPGDFVYFDSPYVPVSQTADFTDYTKDGFSYDDHVRLADFFRYLDSRNVFVMLTNNNVPLVHKLYAGYKIEDVAVRRNINSDAGKRTGKEVIITNYEW